MKKHSFAPIVNDTCRILILGSVPGEESLRQQQYYANPRNQFWKIIYHIFNAEMDRDYNYKVNFLLSRQIALWDVIESCHREGSLDANIENAVVNDFYHLYKQYSKIEHICFNGQMAYILYRKHVGLIDGKSFTRLESTSPANTKSLVLKLKSWEVVPTYSIGL